MSVRVDRLVPLDARERASFAQAQVLEFARGKTLAGEWAPEEAEALSRRAHEALLADALGPDHRLLKALDAEGSLAAWLWVGPPPGALAAPGVAWLYQITVPGDRRGSGWGRAALAALERDLAARGARTLRLNVFRSNGRALSLYRAAGYREVDAGDTWLHLEKPL